jgi:acyl-CoA dehydrogenase
MDFKLEKKYLEIQEQARAFATAVEPIAVEADEMSELHPGLLSALQDSGLAGLMVPAEFGGQLDRLDPLAICLVREVLMATSANADSLFAMQGIGSYAITAAGSAEQRAEWLPRVAKAQALPALALTEPDAGSDLKSVTTELLPGAGGLVLRGAKSFISNAGAASFYEVFAREGSGYSMVLVPADAEGVSVTPTPELIAPHVLGEVDFDDVVLPEDARLGEAGSGLQLVLATLGVFRPACSSAGRWPVWGRWRSCWPTAGQRSRWHGS